MGICVDFLIKHIRPYGIDAYNFLCEENRGLEEWLLNNNVSQNDINIAFNNWAITANKIIDQSTLNEFAYTAGEISRIRWDELYETKYSTILFLNKPLLKELSWNAENNRGRSFELSLYENIPLAITISKRGGYRAYVDAKGAELIADNHGNCCHFQSLIE